MEQYKILKPIKILDLVLEGTIDKEKLETYFSQNTINILILDNYVTPESKMEVVEGCVLRNADKGHKNILFDFNPNPINSGFDKSILIKNPPKLLSEVLRKIEAGECYERYIDDDAINHLNDINDELRGMSPTRGGDFLYKILIIPMEANNG